MSLAQPVSFTQTHADGWTSGPHPWSAKSSGIIRHNLTRTDTPEPCVRVVVTHEGGLHTTLKRRVK